MTGGRGEHNYKRRSTATVIPEYRGETKHAKCNTTTPGRGSIWNRLKPSSCQESRVASETKNPATREEGKGVETIQTTDRRSILNRIGPSTRQDSRESSTAEEPAEVEYREDTQAKLPTCCNCGKPKTVPTLSTQDLDRIERIRERTNEKFKVIQRALRSIVEIGKYNQDRLLDIGQESGASTAIEESVEDAVSEFEHITEQLEKLDSFCRDRLRSTADKDRRCRHTHRHTDQAETPQGRTRRY